MKESFYYVRSNGNDFVLWEHLGDADTQGHYMNATEDFPCCEEGFLEMPFENQKRKCLYFLLDIADNMYDASWDSEILNNLSGIFSEIYNNPSNYTIMAELNLSW